MALSPQKLDAALVIATDAAQKAGQIINECIDNREKLQIEAKSSPVDLVTQYDKQCEELIFSMLKQFDESFKLIGEETVSDGQEVLTDDPTWIVDPIDGTASFVHNSFDCCVSIGLAVNKKPVLGVVCVPRLRETFSAIEGCGAFCNGKRISVSGTKEISKAIVVTHPPYRRTKETIAALCAMNASLLELGVHAVRSYGSCAMDMCSVAYGRVDMYMEIGVRAWDMCAGAIILREAGGTVHNIAEENDQSRLDLCAKGISCGASQELALLGTQLAKSSGYVNALFAVTAFA